MADYSKQEHNDHVILIWLSGAMLVLLGWTFFQGRYRTASRGGDLNKRVLQGSAVRGAALDNSLGQVTPNDLLWWGPTMRPPHWTPHRVTYPATPGANLEMLINGGPMACVTNSVPRELRGWLFNPPAEVDY